jgi:protein gp37
MADHTAIEWTDATWPVTVGCDHVSPGCDHCYAAKLTSGRLKHRPEYAGLAENGRFNGTVRTLPDRLDWPLKWRKPRRVFVCSMSDLFHDSVPDEFIARVFAVMALTPRHTFQVLTKRHARMRTTLGRHGFWTRVGLAALEDHDRWPPNEGVSLDAHALPNVWLGVSVETQQWADIRIPALLDTPAAVRWISAEPLLGPVNLNSLPDGVKLDGGPRGSSALTEACPSCGGWGADCGVDDYHFVRRHGGLDWVVAGGESGAGARPAHPDWFRQLRDQCQTAGVPFLFKQWGNWAPTGAHGVGVPRPRRLFLTPSTVDPVTCCTIPAGPEVANVGKKTAGRELDGRTWDEYPIAAAVPA